MNSFEILPHTADTRLKAGGADLPELFAAAVSGMAEILKKGQCQDIKHRVFDIKREISITAPNATILLIDFLSEVLTASHEEKAVFCRIEFEKISGTEAKAKIFGARVDGFDEDIKAATYHEAEIVKTDEGVETVIVFDI